MRIRNLGVALAFGLLGAGAVHAEDSLTVANGLGGLLGVEEHCGISFDQAAVALHIEAHVAADDAEFVGYLGSFIRAAARAYTSANPTEQTVICTQAQRAAKAFGIVAE